MPDMPTTAAPASTPAIDDASERFSMIELDLPQAASELPPWAIAACAEIVTAADSAALERIIEPLRVQPEGLGKSAVREALGKRKEELRAARAAANRATAPAAAGLKASSARQVIPTVVGVPSVPEAVAVVEAAPSTVQIAPSLPMTGAFTRLRSGQWGCRIEHRVLGAAPTTAPKPGDVALVRRTNGAAQPKRITGVVWTDGYASLCTFEDVPDGTPPTRALPAAIGSAASEVPGSSRPNDGAPEALARDLAEISTESAANASVADLGAQSSNASSNTGRRLGVGFSSPEQYLEALHRGGLQPHTRAEYITNARRAGLVFDEGALPPANDPNAGLPVGKGITHVPTGPSIFDLPKPQRKLIVGKSDGALTGQKLMKAGDLIGGAIAAGAGGEFGWEGSRSCTRGDLITALETIGRAGDAPAAKDARAQIGRSVRTLANDYDVQALQGAARKDLPSGVSHCHIVARKLTGSDVKLVGAGAATAEASRGLVTVQILLKVYLHDDDTVSFEGDESLAGAVRCDFDSRTANQVLISADLTAWLQRVLINAHGATSYGRHWYVPGGQREAAIALTRAVRSTGWGCRWLHGSTLTTEAAVIEGLTEGLEDELVACERDWAAVVAKAAEDAKPISPAVAARRLAVLIEVGERIRGYALLLGDDAVAPLRTRIVALEDVMRQFTDDTSQRGALLEFS